MECEGLKCYKVKDEDDSKKYPKLNPILPQPPFLLLGIGSVRSGKTNTLINMLRREDMYGDQFFEDYLIVSNTINNDKKGKFLKDAFRVEDHWENKFVDDLVTKAKETEDRDDLETTLIVLDDIISSDFKKTTSNTINSLATRFRHFEFSIMIFTQSFKAVSNMIRANASDVMIFRQQSNTELEKIEEEYSDLAPKNFLNYYKIAHSSPYRFLYISIQDNPAKFYDCFESLIGIGDKMIYTGPIPDGEDEVFEKQPKKNKNKNKK